MKTTPQNHLQGIFTQKGSPLEKIFAAYEAHQNISKAFQKDLPSEYQQQVKLLLYREGVMTLGVSNSALFSRLNYSKETLLAHFKQAAFWVSLREIKLKLVS